MALIGAGETADDRPQAGQPHDGKVPTLRGGPDAGRPTSGNEGKAGGHQASPSPSVSILTLEPEHVGDLAGGRRLRVGDNNYRPDKDSKTGKQRQRTVLDLRGTASAIPSWRMTWAAKQLVRVTSAAGRAAFIVEPAGTWHRVFKGLDGDGYRVSMREVAAGLLVTIWTKPAQQPHSARVVEAAPRVELVVTLRRLPDDLRRWRASIKQDVGESEAIVTVRSFNPLIGKAEALAQVANVYQPASLAVMDRGGIRRLLGDDVRVRQVDLRAALHRLTGWSPTQASPDWLVLQRANDE